MKNYPIHIQILNIYLLYNHMLCIFYTTYKTLYLGLLSLSFTYMVVVVPAYNFLDSSCSQHEWIEKEVPKF